MPNIVIDQAFLTSWNNRQAPDMPAPVLRAYVYCLRLADADGRFYVSHNTLAERIGCRRRAGIRTMGVLLASGLVHRTKRGDRGRASDYRLSRLRTLDIDGARRVLQAKPKPGSGRVGHHGSGVGDHQGSGLLGAPGSGLGGHSTQTEDSDDGRPTAGPSVSGSSS